MLLFFAFEPFLERFLAGGCGVESVLAFDDLVISVFLRFGARFFFGFSSGGGGVGSVRNN